MNDDPYLLDAREYAMLVIDWFYLRTGGWVDEDDLSRMRDGVRSIKVPSVWGAVTEVLLDAALTASTAADRDQVSQWACELHDAVTIEEYDDEGSVLAVLLAEPAFLDGVMRVLTQRGVENPLGRLIGERLFEAVRVLSVTSRDLFIEGRAVSLLYPGLYEPTPELFMGREGWEQKATVVTVACGVPATATRAWLGGLPPRVVCESLGLYTPAEQKIFCSLCEHDDVRLVDLAEVVRDQVTASHPG